MPHTSKEDQAKVAANGGLAITKGDMCREEYVPLVRAWKKERRWTTAHNLLAGMFGFTDGQAAKVLAFLEFYIRHVHPYELEKIAENGEAE